MSKSKEPKPLTVEDVKKAVRAAAEDQLIHPSKVTLSMLKSKDDRVTEWSLRQFGGITGIKKYFPVTTKDLAEIKKQKDIQSYVTKLEKELGEKINFEDQVLSTISEAIGMLEPKTVKIPRPKLLKNRKNMTMEAMLSDIHFGKKTEDFDLKVLRDRLRQYTKTFLSQMEYKKIEGYNVERVIIALLGDIIESFTMHGLESATSCEFGNPKQIYSAIKVLFDEVFLPIASTGLPIHVPAVSGNHDRTEQNRTFNNPGENYMTYVIYNCIKDYCELAGLENVTFDIPSSSYTTYEIYGHTVLAEHLEHVRNTTKAALEKLLQERAKQTGKNIKMVRGGHWHEYVCYERGRFIVNESACGQDSFAKIKGYATTPGQVINFYVDDERLPNAFLYSYPVYLE